MQDLTHLDLCSGIGGFALGFRNAGGKTMNKQFIDGVLEVLREDGRQICKQAAHIIAELAEEIEALQSLSDFQRQQK